MTVSLDHQEVKLELKDVLFVPKIRKNLISVGQLTDAGFDVNIRKDELSIEKDGIQMPVPKMKGLYRLEVDDESPQNNQVISEESEPESRDDETSDPQEGFGLNAKGIPGPEKVNKANVASLKNAHELLAHVNKNSVKKFLTLQNIPFKDDLDQCEECILAKQTRVSDYSRPKEAKADSPGVVVADLCSPSTVSIGGCKHFLLITDEYSKFRKAYFLKTKDETAGYIKQYLKWFTNLIGHPIRRFHSDEATEFKNQYVKKILNEIGAEQTFSITRRPQTNGQA